MSMLQLKSEYLDRYCVTIKLIIMVSSQGHWWGFDKTESFLKGLEWDGLEYVNIGCSVSAAVFKGETFTTVDSCFNGRLVKRTSPLSGQKTWSRQTSCIIQYKITLIKQTSCFSGQWTTFMIPNSNYVFIQRTDIKF